MLDKRADGQTDGRNYYSISRSAQLYYADARKKRVTVFVVVMKIVNSPFISQVISVVL